MKAFQNILIVRTDRIGDVVLTTPAIKVLRQAYPGARISILISPATRDLIEGNPYLDEIIMDDRENEHRGWKGLIRLAALLRRLKFDLAIIYHTKKRTNLMCFLAGIPCRVGYKNNKLGFLLTDPIADERHHGRRHEAQYCLDVLQHLGIGGNEIFRKSLEDLADDLYVAVRPESECWIEELWQKNRIHSYECVAAIHPGASDPSKRWPWYRFCELIDQLAQRYDSRIVLVGTNDGRDAASLVLSRIRVPALDLTGQMTLSQLASLLRRCRLLVSNDSGPVHVAAGVGTPVVSIFTRNHPGINPQRWQPLGRKSRFVSAAFDTSIFFAKSAAANPQYLEAISTQQVLEAVDSIFKLC